MSAKVVGYRKLVLGVAYICASTFLAYAAIKHGTDLVGVATVIGAMGAGVFGVVWGNLQSKKVEKVDAA